MSEHQLIQIRDDQRLHSCEPELYTRGHVYAAEDVTRKQMLIVAQKVANLAHAIADTTGESPPIACLYESANSLVRRGRVGSFKVNRMRPEDLPGWLDAARRRYDQLVISASNPHSWRIQAAATAS